MRGFDDKMDTVFFFQAEDGIRDLTVTGVQTCALPIFTLPDPGLDLDIGGRAVQRPPAAGPDDLDVEVRQRRADEAELAGRDGGLQAFVFPGHLTAEQIQRPARRDAPPGAPRPPAAR